MNISSNRLVSEAVKRLEVKTGFSDATSVTPAHYFAEIEELGIKCSEFTEEDAVKMVTDEASVVLTQRLSLAKKILKSRP